MRSIKFYIGTLFGIFLCLSIMGKASTYNSEEISYDNSTSGAEAENVKEAIDWLYTNAGIKGECPEDMTCMESPVVTLNVEGPGTTNKENVHVRIGGSTKFKATPDEGKTLDSIICTNGYTLGSFKTATNSSREEASVEQEISISNPGANEGGTCTIRFLDKLLCKRATELHTQGGKTFGSLGTSRTLTSGDAFDCDVNGDGTYNKDNERFYYITDLEGDSNKAVLLFYSNTSEGVASPSKIVAYNTNSVNNHGPVNASEDLPSLSQWKTTIYSNPRQITNEKGDNIILYNYGDRAARLITISVLKASCGRTDNMNSTGSLDTCTYTMENTKYAETSLPQGYWLENSSSSSSSSSMHVLSSDRRITYNNVIASTISLGARPVIEVLKSEISY